MTALFIRAGTFSPLKNCRDWIISASDSMFFAAMNGKGLSKRLTSFLIFGRSSFRLFKKLSDRHGECIQINDHTRLVHHYGNSFSAVSKLDPLLISQRLGIYENNRKVSVKLNNQHVYRFEEARIIFGCTILAGVEKPAQERMHYLVTAYIALGFLLLRK